jgi:hypothetical protein
MKANKIFENYPSEEDSSWTEFQMNMFGGINLITKVQVSEEDTEELSNESIDPMILDEFLLKKLGLNYKEVKDLELEEDFSINNYNQKNEIVIFKTNLGNVEVSLKELQNLVEIRHKVWRKEA